MVGPPALPATATASMRPASASGRVAAGRPGCRGPKSAASANRPAPMGNTTGFDHGATPGSQPVPGLSPSPGQGGGRMPALHARRWRRAPVQLDEAGFTVRIRRGTGGRLGAATFRACAVGGIPRHQPGRVRNRRVELVKSAGDVNGAPQVECGVAPLSRRADRLGLRRVLREAPQHGARIPVASSPASASSSRARRVRGSDRAAEMQDGQSQSSAAREFRHARARAAVHGVVLERHEGGMAARQLAQQGLVQWLDEAHVDDRGVELRPPSAPAPARSRRPAGQAAPGGAGPPCRWAGERDLSTAMPGPLPGCTAAGPVCRKPVVSSCRHCSRRPVPSPPLGMQRKCGQIEAARVRGAIRSDHAGAVDGEGDVRSGSPRRARAGRGALQEGGIDRHYRLGAFAKAMPAARVTACCSAMATSK